MCSTFRLTTIAVAGKYFVGSRDALNAALDQESIS
jgi:hypothetical protein